MAKKIQVSNDQREMIGIILGLGEKIGEDPRMTSVMLGHLVSTRSGNLLTLELKETMKSYAKIALSKETAE